MSQLSDLLKAADDRHHMTARKRAEKIEGRLHFGTIAAYQRGDHPVQPSEEILQALADAYDLKLSEVQDAAGVPVGEGGMWELPPEAARLNRRQRAAVVELILSIAKDEEARDAGPVGNVRHLRAAPRPLPDDLSELAADAQDGPTAQQANEELRRQHDAGEENQDPL